MRLNLRRTAVQIFVFGAILPAIFALSQNELNELARKFKYYHAAVRPSAPENYVSNQNGTFFSVPLHIHILNTRISNRELWVDAVVVAGWVDERLRLRELFERVQLPPEFAAWHPSLLFSLPVASQFTTLAPGTGLVSVYTTVKNVAQCTAQAWKYPFESFECVFSVETDGDEALIVAEFDDARSNAEKFLTSAKLGEFPDCAVTFTFRAEWPRAVLSAFLPCILLLSSVFFAQWKRRKIQILVSLAVVVCLLILMCAQRPYTVATLMDLWLCANFVHCVFLVLVDVTLPARRVRYTLMVHVDPVAQRASPVQMLTQSNTEVPGPFRFLSRVLSKVARHSPNTSTTIVTASPGACPIQRQLTTAMLGSRKRLALCLVGLSYIVFLLFYALVVVSID